MGQLLSGILGTDNFVVVVVEGLACAGQFPNKFPAEQKLREKKILQGEPCVGKNRATDVC